MFLYTVYFFSLHATMADMKILNEKNLAKLSKIFRDTLGLEIKGDDLVSAAYAIAKFVCVKELHEYKLRVAKEKNGK